MVIVKVTVTVTVTRYRGNVADDSEPPFYDSRYDKQPFAINKQVKM